MIKQGQGSRLDVFVVWIPMQRGDSIEAAREAAGAFKHTDVQQFWDGKRILAGLVGSSVGFEPAVVAWDIYLGYEGGAVFSDRAPTPADWVHQLGKAPADRFRGGRIAEAVARMADRLLAPESRR